MTESASWIVKQITELSWKGGGNHDVDLGLRGQDFIWVGRGPLHGRSKNARVTFDLDIQSQYSRIDKRKVLKILQSSSESEEETSTNKCFYFFRKDQMQINVKCLVCFALVWYADWRWIRDEKYLI